MRHQSKLSTNGPALSLALLLLVLLLLLFGNNSHHNNMSASSSINHHDDESTTSLDVKKDSHEWRHQQPGDVRSPCPALNTLANHGFL